MFSFSELNELQVIVFGLILLRMIAFVFSAAIFSSQSVPVPFRILFAMVLTIVVFPIVATNEALVKIEELTSQIIYLAAVEVVIGLCIGFVTRLFFFTVSMTGELMAISIGIGQGQIFNPMLGSTSNPLEQFIVFLGTIFYFMINGHHYLIQGLINSFQMASIARTAISTDALMAIVYMAQKFLIIGVQISAPVLVSMLVIQLGTGLVSRAVPQINFLTTSVGISIGLGFFILMISLPLFFNSINNLVAVTTGDLFSFIKGL